MIFSRQNLAFQTRTQAQIADVAKGGYVLAKEKGELKASSLPQVQKLHWQWSLRSIRRRTCGIYAMC